MVDPTDIQYKVAASFPSEMISENFSIAVQTIVSSHKPNIKKKLI